MKYKLYVIAKEKKKPWYRGRKQHVTRDGENPILNGKDKKEE